VIKTEAGASSANEAPANQVSAVKQITYNNNSSAKGQARKPFKQSLSGDWHPETKAQLETYLALGLVPIPLKGKIPQIKWRHGWNPKTIEDLAPFKRYTNWGIKTGGNLGVIDFDSPEIFAKFAADNIDLLPDGLPLVKTGRGYHLWFTPSEPLRDAHFEGIDLKAEGGQVCVPPSIHPTTNRPYRFLWHLGNIIPELDLNTLHFSVKKRVINNPATTAGHIKDATSKTESKNDNQGIQTDKPRFDFNTIKDGVDAGQRNTALVSYIGHLIWHDLSKEQILILVTDWNQSNRPPLTKEEIEITVNNCYLRYAKEKTPGKNNVPIKTYYQINSVLNVTQTPQSISHDPSQRTRKTASSSPTQEPVSAWDTEDDRPPNYFDCGKKRAVMCRGHEYLSVSFFCGRWDCKRCGPYFRRRWIDHLVAKTAGLELYTTEASEADWGRIRRSLNRLGGNYVRIKNGNSFTLITDTPLKPSTPLRQDELQAFLENAIPSTASQCPISTSRNWKREKNTKKENDFKSVAVTWLPLKDQLEVAQELGAKKVLYNKWISPEETDDTEWAEKFKKGIAERERSILQWLIVPKNSKVIPEMATEWQYYLNQQYAEDELNDESGYRSFFDSYLVEAA
jgi:Bifunctional DNA primase/polymerase, N-terminal/Primase C terminal 1 (PriCT-1)